MTTNKKIESSKYFKENFKKPIIGDIIFTVIIFLIIIMIISNPTNYTSGTISGLKLFVFNVLPGLFPFMLLTKLITEIGLVFNVSQKLDKFSYSVFGTPGVSVYAFIMSIVSGYPIGAKIINDLYQKGQINEHDAKKMSVFCTTSGPIFVIGTVGTIMFQSFKFGIILYASHILSSVLIGVLYNLFTKNKASKNTQPHQFIYITKKSNILSECVNQTINSLFVVGAYITIFYLIGELFNNINLFAVLTKTLNPVFSKLGFSITHIEGLLYGILEVTRGAKILSSTPNICSVALASGIISFSGLSIIFQSMAFLKDAKIKAHNFIFSKCVHAIFSILLCYILLIIF